MMELMVNRSHNKLAIIKYLILINFANNIFEFILNNNSLTFTIRFINILF